MPVNWPWPVVPKQARWALVSASRSSGRSITGSEQVVVSGAGFWKVSFEIDLGTESRMVPWRAFIAQLNGRSGVADIPAFDIYGPSDLWGRRRQFNAVATGGVITLDHAGLAQTPSADVVFAAEASLGGTRVMLSASASWQIPRPGMYFGVGGRLYRARTVSQNTPSSSWQVDIQPPLRASVLAGASVVVDYPTCQMRLAEDGGGEPDFKARTLGSVSVEFVEAI
jgi:hypothetical protein